MLSYSDFLNAQFIIDENVKIDVEKSVMVDVSKFIFNWKQFDTLSVSDLQKSVDLKVKNIKLDLNPIFIKTTSLKKKMKCAKKVKKLYPTMTIEENKNLNEYSMFFFDRQYLTGIEVFDKGKRIERYNINNKRITDHSYVSYVNDTLIVIKTFSYKRNKLRNIYIFDELVNDVIDFQINENGLCGIKYEFGAHFKNKIALKYGTEIANSFYGIYYKFTKLGEIYVSFL